MLGRGVVGSVLLVGSLIACEGSGVEPVGGSTAGSEDDGAVLLADIELTRQCDRVGAVEVQVRARRVGCEQPGPCTVPTEPPEVWGDRATCPSGEATRWMGVPIARSGRYLVDAVVRFATGDPATVCLVDGGEVEVLVASSEIDAGAERILEATASPCPEP